MQRRQFIKWLVPVSLVATGLVAGVSIFRKSACAVLDLPALLKRLQLFSDAELGKKISLELGANDLKRFDGLCEETFDESYRQLAAKDFAEGKIKNVDGWLLSDTEVITHRSVYLYQVSLSGALPAADSRP